MGPRSCLWKMANAHSRPWNSHLPLVIPQGCSEAVHKLATKPVAFGTWPQRCFTQALAFLNRAADLLFIHCCCCCHHSRLVRFLFSSGCLLQSLSHGRVETVLRLESRWHRGMVVFCHTCRVDGTSFRLVLYHTVFVVVPPSHRVELNRCRLSPTLQMSVLTRTLFCVFSVVFL